MGKPPRNMSSSEWMLYKGQASIQQGHVCKRAAALESRLGHLERKERPKELPSISMRLGEYRKIKARVAAKVDGFSASFNGNEVLSQVSMPVLAGKRTFLTGNNGSGKTTLIRKLLEREENTFITSEAKIGYFSQEQENLEEEKTVLENVMSTAIVPEHICRAVLMNLYMKENDIFKKVRVLSGGEKVKTAIAKVLVSDCNFLILDEPTNHMDIYTMEGLEKLLLSYDGTLLIVSHDRKLINNLADVTYVIRDGQIYEKG
jgi:ATPase subunit of ABC transporter with duplicated ATPase domains